ncbi:MAG: DNA polymerase III subunit gamma/tau [Candidatus Gracilibacteria bacterium]|nr:DNA polymerase III subunit gamma/tau [Candidatus Gracilibacteria bacterium]
MSLYLKYRPADFKNLVGQTFVKETLQKAIENNKTVGAYLFCGPRGTGKTSSARIFAKAINCENPINGNPCLECSICLDFAQEKLIDIIEIDAASNTGVDNIREIIEKAQFSPTKTKYKIYIIDEVHMLSKGAFNALLKILEEPPSHVKFILATTETHKVPETIISRCQRYDFKRISNTDIKNRLEYIAGAENIRFDDKAIEYVVKNSGGGLRNAISLFEQLITNDEINYEHIVKKLEIVDENIIESFLNKLLEKDQTAIEIFEKNIEDGKNIKLFFKELLFYTKAKSLNELRLNNDITKYIDILDILDDTYSKTKNSLDENTTFLIGILKILNGYNNKIIHTQNNIQTINTGNTSNTRQAEPTKNKVEKHENNVKDTISHDDVFDIFGDEPSTDSQTNNQVDSNTSNTNSTRFDTNTFKIKLKENGAKGGLVLAIPAAEIELYGDTLSIGTKTKIHRGQFENVDNQNIICKALTEMGIQNPKIKLN